MSVGTRENAEVRDPEGLMDDVRDVLEGSTGEITPDIADELDAHPSTIRDALYRLEDVGEAEQRWDLRDPNRHMWVPTGDLDV